MKRFGRLAFELLLGITLCLVVTVSLAHQANSDPLTWLDARKTTDCALPCWRGITPGLTSFPDALEMLHHMPEVDQSSINGRSEVSTTWLWFIYRAGSHRIYGEFDGEISAQIRSIWFYPVRDGNALTIRLADLDSRFGPPQWISAVSANNALFHLTYRLPGVEALVFIPRGTKGRPGCDRLQTSAGVYLGVPIQRAFEDRWHGFTARFNQACTRTP